MNSLKALFSPALAKHDFKRYRALLVFFGIFIFLAGPFVLIFAISISGEKLPVAIFQYIDDIENDIAPVVNILCTSFAMIAAVVTASVVCNRYTNKNSAYFYGGLPVKRTAAFITDTVMGFLNFLIPLVGNSVIFALIMIFCTDIPALTVCSLLWKMVLEASAYFVIIYSVFILAGQICATNAAQVVLGATLTGWLAAFCGTLLLLFSVFDPSFDSDYYAEYTMRLSPVSDYYIRKFNGGLTLSTVVWLIAAVVLFVLAGFVFAKRKSEMAGEPLTVKPTRYIVRFLYIVPVGIGSAMMFYAISDKNMLWLVIGYLVGALLSHMIVNAIIFKNVGKMFYGIVSFVIIAGLGLVSVFAVKGNWLSLNKIPDVNDVVSLEVEGFDFKRGEITLDDKELIKEMYEILDDAEYRTEYDFYSEDGYICIVDDEGNLTKKSKGFNFVSVVYHKAAGLPVARTYTSVLLDEKNYQRLEAFTNSEKLKQYEFEKFYKPFFKKFKESKGDTIITSWTLQNQEPAVGIKLAECIEKDMAAGRWNGEVLYNVCFDLPDYKNNGDLFDVDSLVNGLSNYVSIEITENMTESVHYLKCLGVNPDPEYLAKNIDFINMYFSYGENNLTDEDDSINIARTLDNEEIFESFLKALFENKVVYDENGDFAVKEDIEEGEYEGNCWMVTATLKNGNIYDTECFVSKEAEELAKFLIPARPSDADIEEIEEIDEPVPVE